MTTALLLAATLVTMTPDYAGITVPPNMAPLNFDLDREASVELAADGARLEARGRKIRFPVAAWHDFLARCKGRSYTLTVRPADGTAPLVATNAVSADAIDGHLTYRLIPPSYTTFDVIGIYQRDLANFDERPLYRNIQSARSQCVNCHTYRQCDPDTFLFHKRAYDSGTVIAHPKYGLHLHQIKPERGYAGNGTYPAWHPSGEFIAFSINETRQSFLLSDARKIEVADLQSDLALYVLADRSLVQIEDEPQVWECFPTWSPDGTRLYISRTTVDFPIARTNEPERVERTFSGIGKIRYDIAVRRFDAKTRSFSKPETLLDSSRLSASFLFPRVSPDGRWMVVTAAHFGVFPIWHREADLFILDLRNLSLRRLDEINSPETDSYHAFSSDGTWMVFSSRRLDGNYTRPFFAHFDATRGRFSKPFLIPVEDPAEHGRRFLSYNVPEFSTGPVKYSPRELRRTR